MYTSKTSGVLAIGSSGPLSMMLGDDLELQVEGPFGFIQIKLDNLNVIESLRESLETGLQLNLISKPISPTIGTFCGRPVRVLWDLEYEDMGTAGRLFVNIDGPQCINYVISNENLTHFTQCVSQLVEDLK